MKTKYILENGLLEQLKRDAEFLSLLEKKPSKHYKVFKIPKRTIGFRTIAQPTPKLKKYQKEIVSILEPLLSIHPSATAYRKGAGIKENATVHLKSNYLIKMDLVDFFNSISPQFLFNVLEKQLPINNFDKSIISEFLFWNRSKRHNGKLMLSVGAPSSPFVSNVVMYEFDSLICEYCQKAGINYSRYADDLTFSTKTKNILFDVPQVVNTALNTCFQGKMKINKKKTVISSKGHNRHITGVTLTNDNKLSIGRERKKYISALVHKSMHGLLDEGDVQHLKGLMGFAQHIEPGFVDNLKRKYGSDVILELLKMNLESSNE